MEQLEAMEKKAGGSRLKKGGAGGAPLIALGLTALILGGTYLGLCAYAQNSAAIWKNTYVLGQEIGGLTQEEAVQKVEAALPDLTIGLQLYDPETGPVDTGSPDGLSASIPLSGLGAEVDVPALVAGAKEAASSGPFLTAGYRYMAGPSRYDYGNPEAIRLDSAKTAETAERVAGDLSWPAVDTSYDVEEDALLVRMPMDGRSVDAADLKQTLESRVWASAHTISFPCKTLSPTVVLTAREIHDAVGGVMKNAGYDPETDTITPEEMGADFDVAAAQKLMDEAEPGSTVRIPADIQIPAVTAGDLEAVLFRDVLGSASTHVGGSSIRRGNVKLAGESCNGVVLNDGDVFDYNAVVGKRTTDRGFGAAPAYVNGETVDTIGGGICQVSSTIYYATLLANLEIVERYAHRYAPSYITWGMDATVSWGGPEFRFKNDTGYPIRLDVTYDSKNNIKVDIVGTKTDDTYVKMTYKNLGDIPYETERIETADLDWGTEQQKQSPYTGHQVVSYRNVYKGDGTLISSELEAKSNYKSRNEIILVGTRGKPAMGTTIPEFGGGTGEGTGGDTGPTLPPDDWTDGPILPPEEPEKPDDGSPGLAIFG